MKPQIALTPAAGEASVPPLDRDHLARQTLGDRDLERELLTIFASQARAIVGTLGTPGPRTDPGALLHKLCGSARAVGSWQVAEAAETLEAEVRAGDPDAVDAVRLAALEGRVERACAAIEAIVTPDP